MMRGDDMSTLSTKIREAEIQLEKGNDMRDTALKQLYEIARNTEPNQAMKLVQRAEDDEERRFYAFIAEMNLQRAQKKAIERNLF